MARSRRVGYACVSARHVFDKRYYEGIGWPNGGKQAGTPRNLMVTLDYRL